MLKDSNSIVTQANRQKIELSGMVHLSIEVGGIKFWLKLYIAPDLDRTMISGADWFKKNQDTFKFKLIKIKGGKISTWNLLIKQY